MAEVLSATIGAIEICTAYTSFLSQIKQFHSPATRDFSWILTKRMKSYMDFGSEVRSWHRQGQPGGGKTMLALRYKELGGTDLDFADGQKQLSDEGLSRKIFAVLAMMDEKIPRWTDPMRRDRRNGAPETWPPGLSRPDTWYLSSTAFSVSWAAILPVADPLVNAELRHSISTLRETLKPPPPDLVPFAAMERMIAGRQLLDVWSLGCVFAGALDYVNKIPPTVHLAVDDDIQWSIDSFLGTFDQRSQNLAFPNGSDQTKPLSDHLRQISEALAFLHNTMSVDEDDSMSWIGVAHGALMPENISIFGGSRDSMLCDWGEFKLADFGLAELEAATPRQRYRPTSTRGTVDPTGAFARLSFPNDAATLASTIESLISRTAVSNDSMLRELESFLLPILRDSEPHSSPVPDPSWMQKTLANDEGAPGPLSEDPFVPSCSLACFMADAGHSPGSFGNSYGNATQRTQMPIWTAC